MLKLEKPISWLDGVDTSTGVIKQKNHPQKGISITGKTVVVPGSIGSTVGAYTFFKLVKNGSAPRKIVLTGPDSVTIGAVLAGIEVELSGSRGTKYKLRIKGVPERFVRYLEKEAEMTEAEEFIPVRSVHLSGISYATIGKAGLEFLREIHSSGVHFQTLTTTNPAGMDLERWRDMGVPGSFAEKQLEIVSLLTEMGAIPTLTCTPYLSGNLPLFGEHVCWGESSAVAFANSVLGARTNREGSVKGMVAAACGCIPLYGKHLERNRQPTLKVVLKCNLSGPMEFGLLGFLIGREFPDAVPLISGINKMKLSELKALSAGGAASGGIELFHVKGVTPEAQLYERYDTTSTLPVGKREILSLREDLSTFNSSPDLLALGCPHFSAEELLEFMKMVQGKRALVRTWIFTSRTLLTAFRRSGHLRILKTAGVEVYADTCMVVCPLERMGFRKVATNSPKAAKYLRSMRGVDVMLVSLREITNKFFS